MKAANTLEQTIVSNPEYHAGRPTIAGTGVAVRTVVGHYKLGLTAEEIADEMALELAGVYAALAYFHLNREEVEADIADNLEVAVMQWVHRA